MASTCITSLDLCAIRVSKLTEAGAPSDGATNGYVSNEAIKIEVGVTLTTGQEIEQKNGCGDLCATFSEPDKIKGLTLAMDLCQLDAYLLNILTGASLFESGGEAIGFQFPAVGSTPDPVCIEAWTKAWDLSQQATPAFTTPNAAYIHWVFPYTRWTHGNLVQEHNLMVVPVSAKGQENSSITINGPFDDWPAAVANAGGVTRIGGWFYDAVLPTGDCDWVAVTGGGS